MFSSDAPNAAAAESSSAAAAAAAREGRKRSVDKKEGESMHRNGEGKKGRGKETRREKDHRCCRCEQPVLISEVFLLQDGGIAEGMLGAGLGFVSR